MDANEIELVSAARCRIFKRTKNKVPLEVTYHYRCCNSFEYRLGCFVGDIKSKGGRIPTICGDLTRVLPLVGSVGQIVYLFSAFAEVSRHSFFTRKE